MKTVGMIVVGLLIATVAIGDNTNEFTTLQKSYEASVKQAIAPLTKAYLQKLDTLKKKYGANGDLKSAQTVQDEIDRLASKDVSVVDTSPKAKWMSAIVGKWKRSGCVVEIKADGTFIDITRNIRGTWGLTEKGGFAMRWGDSGQVTQCTKPINSEFIETRVGGGQSTIVRVKDEDKTE